MLLEARLTDPWRDTLRSVDEELLLWTRAYRKRHGQTRPMPLANDVEDPEESDEGIEAEWDTDDDAEVVTTGREA